MLHQIGISQRDEDLFFLHLQDGMLVIVDHTRHNFVEPLLFGHVLLLLHGRQLVAFAGQCVGNAPNLGVAVRQKVITRAKSRSVGLCRGLFQHFLVVRRAQSQFVGHQLLINIRRHQGAVHLRLLFGGRGGRPESSFHGLGGDNNGAFAIAQHQFQEFPLTGLKMLLHFPHAAEGHRQRAGGCRRETGTAACGKGFDRDLLP